MGSRSCEMKRGPDALLGWSGRECRTTTPALLYQNRTARPVLCAGRGEPKDRVVAAPAARTANAAAIRRTAGRCPISPGYEGTSRVSPVPWPASRGGRRTGGICFACTGHPDDRHGRTTVHQDQPRGPPAIHGSLLRTSHSSCSGITNAVIRACSYEVSCVAESASPAQVRPYRPRPTSDAYSVGCLRVGASPRRPSTSILMACASWSTAAYPFPHPHE